MKTLLTALIVLTCMTRCSTAQAGVRDVLLKDASFGIGVTTFDQDRATSAGLNYIKFVELTSRITGEFWQQTDGSKLDENMTGLGVHYAVLKDSDANFAITTGGGLGIRQWLEPYTDAGSFLALGLEVANMRVAARTYWGLGDKRSWTPSLTFQVGLKVPDWGPF